LQRLQANGETADLGADQIKDLKSAINVGANAIGITPPINISNQEEMESFGRTLVTRLTPSAASARRDWQMRRRQGSNCQSSAEVICPTKQGITRWNLWQRRRPPWHNAPGMS
jgi:hypothetical protein